MITVILSNYLQRHLLVFFSDSMIRVRSVCANIVVQSDRLEWDRMEYDKTSDRVGVEDRFKRSYSKAKFNLH